MAEPSSPAVLEAEETEAAREEGVCWRDVCANVSVGMLPPGRSLVATSFGQLTDRHTTGDFPGGPEVKTQGFQYKPRSPALQADTLPSEPSRFPFNTGNACSIFG